MVLHIDGKRVFRPDGLLPLSVQRFGMHNLYQAGIVSVVPCTPTRTEASMARAFFSVQTYFSTEEGKTALAAATEMLRIPVNLPLDGTGLLWVHSITKSRFERSQDERQGVQALIDLLREHLNLEIEYDTHGVVYVTPPGEAPIVGLFGRTAEHLDDLAKHWGCSFERAYRIVFKTIHELTKSGPKERKVLTEMFYALSESERHGQDFSAFVDVKSSRRRKPRTKPGPPDIEELKQLLVPRRKKSRRNDLPWLFTSPGPTTVGESPQNESESCD